MLQMKRYLIMLLPLYIIAAESPIKNVLLSETESDYVDIPTIDQNTFEAILASLPALTQEELQRAEDFFSQNSSPDAPHVNNTPSPDLSTNKQTPPLLKSDGTPYIRGPYKKRLTPPKQNPLPKIQQKSPSNIGHTKGKYTKRNIHVGLSWNHPDYRKIYRALYAQAIKQIKG